MHQVRKIIATDKVGTLHSAPPTQLLIAETKIIGSFMEVKLAQPVILFHNAMHHGPGGKMQSRIVKVKTKEAAATTTSLSISKGED